MPVLLGRTVKNTDILFKIHPVEIRALGEELLRFCRVSVWILTGNMDSQTRLWRNGKLLQKALGKLRGASWRVYGCFWPSRRAKRVFSAKKLSSWSPKIISHNRWLLHAYPDNARITPNGRKGPTMAIEMPAKSVGVCVDVSRNVYPPKHSRPWLILLPSTIQNASLFPNVRQIRVPVWQNFV